MSSSQPLYGPGSLVGAQSEEQQGRGCEVAGVRSRCKDADNGDFTFQFWPSLLKKTGQEADSFVYGKLRVKQNPERLIFQLSGGDT